MEANILQLLLWLGEKIPKLEVACLFVWFVVVVLGFFGLVFFIIIFGVFSTY